MLPLDGVTEKFKLSEATEEMVSGEAPVFETVTLSNLVAPTLTLPNAKLDGVKETSGVKPEPVTPTLVGEPEALCVKTILPDFAPELEGLKVIKNFRLAAGASVPRPGVTVKFVLSETTDVIESVAVPVFVTVTLSRFVAATAMVPNATLMGATENCGAGCGILAIMKLSSFTGVANTMPRTQAYHVEGL